MRRFVAALFLGLSLAACGPSDIASAPAADSAGGGYAGIAREEAVAGRAATAPAAEPAPPPPPAQAGETATSSPQPAGPSPVLYLAYTYNIGLELPSTRLSGVVDAHVQACQAAGPRLCQLIGSNKSGDPESYMEGYVSLRGEPQWLATFMAGVAAQADAAGGRITQQTTNAEDLTRQIVDTEARQRALISLRDRLQDLLRSRPGRLSDLLDVERELARVQGELDAISSTLAVMRTRVAMSELTINYRSQPRSVGSDTFRPLRDAFAGFLGIVVAGFAAIITIIAGLIPVAVVVIPLGWLLLRWRRARGGRFFGRAPPPPPPA
ncbi:MAG: DUF4349 domain-containing protein [Hyphomonadaceae bacterium]|nr:DUF4349 domain-containing protein [Hyphomonadaceae bacterium]MBX3511265.1 DUF4349 domain-containing protein [Hyphomonadaceae bacterium]